jgi:16S rRNA (cytidine1402-2'-O)-methyltransferase
MSGRLFLVATPLGNYDDITLRALIVLKDVDIVVCEGLKEGKRLLSHYGIDKPLETLNEHMEKEQSLRILRLLRDGKDVALISDCGTPIIEDPGLLLVQMAIESDIKITMIPGASSICAALVVSGFPLKEFVYRGLLSPKRQTRQEQLRAMKSEYRTFVLMDAPYRLVPLLEDVVAELGPDRDLCVAFDLTMPNEEVKRGSALEMLEYWKSRNHKGEFVIVVRGKARG